MPTVDNETEEHVTYRVNDEPIRDCEDRKQLLKKSGLEFEACKGKSQTHSIGRGKKEPLPFVRGLPNKAKVTIKALEPKLIVEIEFPPNFP